MLDSINNLPLTDKAAKMPSKKKKAKGKGRGAARKELRNDSPGSDDVKNDVTSQMQRLKVNESNQDNDNEDALLEEAINLAAAEREKLDAAEVEKCDHGFVLLPQMHGFMQTEASEKQCLLQAECNYLPFLAKLSFLFASLFASV